PGRLDRDRTAVAQSQGPRPKPLPLALLLDAGPRAGLRRVPSRVGGPDRPEAPAVGALQDHAAAHGLRPGALLEGPNRPELRLSPLDAMAHRAVEPERPVHGHAAQSVAALRGFRALRAARLPRSPTDPSRR